MLLARPSSAPSSSASSTGPLAANAGATALLAIFVASLGIGIAGENVIRLFWGSETQAYYGPARSAHAIWDAIFINFDLWQAASAIAIMLALAAMLRYTALGRRIKATRINPDLAKTIGIDADKIYVICFFIGTICGGVAAIWYALKYTVDPAMGTLPIIYAFVVAFLGGTARSPIRVFLDGHRRGPDRAVLVDLALGAVDADRGVRRAGRLPVLPGHPIERLHGQVQQSRPSHAGRAPTPAEA